MKKRTKPFFWKTGLTSTGQDYGGNQFEIVISISYFVIEVRT